MKTLTRRMLAAVLTCTAMAAHAQTELQTYVQRCQTELQFAASEVRPMNCNDGPNFAFGGRSPENDYVVHQRVNGNVDMVAACRWGDSSPDLANNKFFLSIELLIHNRVNGGTCFFAARDTGTDPRKPVSTNIVAPTNFSATNRPNANDYWLMPTQMNSKPMYSNAVPGIPDYQEKLQCVRCHSQGAYIASKRIAPYLANFGLLNDGHHTYANFSAPGHYYVVGSGDQNQSNPGTNPLGNWNYLINQNNSPGQCSDMCHVRAKTSPERFFSPIGDLTPPNDRRVVVLPSISTDISQLDGFGMPPMDEFSDWRWINGDQPGSDGVEVETFTSNKTRFPVVTYRCGAPTWLEANPVGTGAPFSTLAIGFLPNKLRSFNLRDGLVCMNADQPAGQKCQDYQLSYKCPVADPKWVGPYNKDTNYTDDGDHEERSRAWNDARAACGNKDPIAVRADVVSSGMVTQTATAPADRLAQFTASGLVCRNADQGSGQTCASYAVRFHGCRTGDANLARLKNAWTSPPTFGDRFLTTTNNVDGAETRAQANNYQYPSQDWTVEYLDGGNVRLFDTWSGKYLTASSNTDQATVVVRNPDGSLLRQQWIVETITGSTEVRLRNVGSGRYLTVGNYTSDPNFAPIVSQTLSSQNWASQRWLIN